MSRVLELLKKLNQKTLILGALSLILFIHLVRVVTAQEGASPVLVLLLAAPVLLVAGLLNARRRQRALREWAAQTGWELVQSDPSLVGRWRGTPFNVGRSRTASEVLRGTWDGREAVSFQYEYTTGSGRTRSTTYAHVIALRLPARLPTLELTREGVGAKVAKAFGAQDIQFESAEFNRAWRVVAQDERFAHSVLHPRLMERLMQADAQGMALRLEGDDVLCWSYGGQSLDRIFPRLLVLAAVADSVPRFVWLDHGHDPAAA